MSQARTSTATSQHPHVYRSSQQTQSRQAPQLGATSSIYLCKPVRWSQHLNLVVSTESLTCIIWVTTWRFPCEEVWRVILAAGCKGKAAVHHPLHHPITTNVPTHQRYACLHCTQCVMTNCQVGAQCDCRPYCCLQAFTSVASTMLSAEAGTTRLIAPSNHICTDLAHHLASTLSLYCQLPSRDASGQKNVSDSVKMWAWSFASGTSVQFVYLCKFVHLT